MRKEQPAIEIGDVSQRDSANGLTLAAGLGEPLEEKVAENVREELIRVLLSRGREQVFEVFAIAVRVLRYVEEAFRLEKPDEHEAVQQDGSIPTALASIGDAFDLVEELVMLVLEVAEESLGDGFNVKRGTDTIGSLCDREIAVLIEFGDVHAKGSEF